MEYIKNLCTIIQEGYQDKCQMHDIMMFCNFSDKIQFGGLKISEYNGFILLQVV